MSGNIDEERNLKSILLTVSCSRYPMYLAQTLHPRSWWSYLPSKRQRPTKTDIYVHEFILFHLTEKLKKENVFSKYKWRKWETRIVIEIDEIDRYINKEILGNRSKREIRRHNKYLEIGRGRERERERERERDKKNTIFSQTLGSLGLHWMSSTESVWAFNALALTI